MLDLEETALVDGPLAGMWKKEFLVYLLDIVLLGFPLPGASDLSAEQPLQTALLDTVLGGMAAEAALAELVPVCYVLEETPVAADLAKFVQHLSVHYLDIFDQKEAAALGVLVFQEMEDQHAESDHHGLADFHNNMHKNFEDFLSQMTCLLLCLDLYYHSPYSQTVAAVADHQNY